MPESLKLCTIVGARPQFIKAAVVSRAIGERNRQGTDTVVETIVHTGQHFDANMSDIFFDELAIPRPDHHLGVGGGTHGQNTGRMLEKVEGIFLQDRPDWVLVYGDTDSTLAGALAASKLHIPVAHVEAGLRSYNRRMPEEINRVLTDHVSQLLLTPTDQASKNLAIEGIQGGRVQQVGDVMNDAAIFYGKRALSSSKILEKTGVAPKTYVLATIHRAENTDDPDRLGSILSGLSKSQRPVVLPVHPRLRRRMEEFRLQFPKNLIAIEPVGYLDMVRLEQSASLVATDSGGVQKEAFFHSVPCITLRDETEWVETVEMGWNVLVGADAEKIGDAMHKHGLPVEAHHCCYGNGDAGARIVEVLLAQ
jgi:UDP-GlcNAc3NAcA epimerase